MKNILVLLVLLFINGYASPQVSISAQLVDKDLGLPIPFATITIDETGKGTTTNTNGYFTLTCSNTDSITISHVAYIPVRTTAATAYKRHRIEMQEKTVDINPIVVSAAAGRKEIQRAIDSTFQHLEGYQYFAFTQSDKILRAHETVAEAYAKLHGKTVSVKKPGKGAMSILKLSEYELRTNNAEQEEINSFNFMPLAYINTFGVGINKKHDANLVFTIQDGNDSLAVIAFRPKRSYNIEKKSYALLSGRITIDKSTWRIRQVHFELDSLTKARINTHVIATNSKRNLYKSYQLTLNLNRSGFPIKSVREFVYTRPSDSPSIERRCYSTQEYTPTSENEFRKNKQSLNVRRTLFKQKKKQ